MIGVAILHDDPGRFFPRKRIPHLIFILAPTHLPDMTPIRGWVNNIRVVNPLPHFVRRNARVKRTNSEDPTGIEIEGRIGLEGQRARRVDAVVSTRAAVIEVSWIAERHTRVVEHKHWECLRVHALSGELREGIGHDKIEKINADNAKRSALVSKLPWDDRKSRTVRNVNHDRIENNWFQPDVISLLINCAPEICSLKRIHILCGTYISSSEIEIGIRQYG